MNQNEALVKSAIHDAVIRAVTEISADVKGLLKDALARETNETAQSMLRSMVDNLSIAKEGDKAVCQSPGYPTTWLSFGDGNLPECTREAISEAVAEATKKGYLRPSMVDPLTRENSGNNTGKGPISSMNTTPARNTSTSSSALRAAAPSWATPCRL